MAHLSTCTKALQNRLALLSARQPGMLTRQILANSATVLLLIVKHVRAALNFARHAMPRIHSLTPSLDCAMLVVQLKVFSREKILIPAKHVLIIAPCATLSQTALNAMQTSLL